MKRINSGSAVMTTSLDWQADHKVGAKTLEQG